MIGLNSAPEKGRANEELLKLLARAGGVARSAVVIVRGAGARNKLVRIASDDPHATSARLIAFARPS